MSQETRTSQSSLEIMEWQIVPSIPTVHHEKMKLGFLSQICIRTERRLLSLVRSQSYAVLTVKNRSGHVGRCAMSIAPHDFAAGVFFNFGKAAD